MPGWTSPQQGGLPHLQRSHGENSPQLSRLPGPADRVTRLGGDYPTSHVNEIKKKKEIVWRDWLPHQGRVPHLPGVSNLHVNRPLFCLTPRQSLGP